VLAYASNFGLFAFMAEYFKYLTEIQARRYLHATSYDLSLAIKLVLHERLFQVTAMFAPGWWQDQGHPQNRCSPSRAPCA
jgi:hypothetical protein